MDLAYQVLDACETHQNVVQQPVLFPEPQAQRIIGLRERGLADCEALGNRFLGGKHRRGDHERAGQQGNEKTMNGVALEQGRTIESRCRHCAG
jgi:hypothetical protein